MTAPPSPGFRLGIVKQVLSGDTIIIRRKCTPEPPVSPPPEKLVILNGIVAPKLVRQKPTNSDSENKDEPFAWEAREFLRTLLVGKEVMFLTDKLPNSQSDKEYGKVWAGPNPEVNVNVAQALLAEGFAKLRENSRNHPQNKELVHVEEEAKQHGKGIWSADAECKIRVVKWTIPDPNQFINKHSSKPLKAIVEYVRDGSTVRLCILPEFYNVMVMMAGIRCPAIRQDGTSEPYAEEARYFVEAKLLQREVEVQLVSVSNNNLVGTIIHPTADIAECLVKNGLAKCVDWSMGVMKSGAAQLKKAEKAAKAAKLNIWTDYHSNLVEIPEKDKEFHAVVLEVISGDSLMVKMSNGIKKISLSSIRPPRAKPTEDTDQSRSKPYRPLYDVPWLFEAREFLRKKLVGKKAHIIVDYIQPSKDNIPEKTNCTVLCSGGNVAEGLVSKGLASVMRHRSDDDQRSSRYDKLLEAEQNAIKAAVGIHSKKDIPTHRIQDTSRNAANAKKFFPFLKRLQNTEAIVEYVASGSRMKLYIPKESVLVNFLLAGIVCPRNSRPATNGNASATEAQPCGDEALHFTKEACLQRDVTVSIEDIDKVGNFIGWLFIDNVNMSIALVENGLASLLSTSTGSEYAKKLKDSEDQAQKQQKGIWKNYVEKEVAPKETTTVVERRVNYENVKITTINAEGFFYVQNIDMANQLRALMSNISQEFQNNPPLPGAYWPNRGKICAARFSGDGQWYRAKIERVNDNTVVVYYIDYGNREELNHTHLAELPAIFLVDPPFATECILACIKFAKDRDDKLEALQNFAQDALGKNLLLNNEIKGSPMGVSLVDPATKHDIAKKLISDGWVLVSDPHARRLAPLVAEYNAAQEQAVKSRLNIWRHGDIREDDVSGFGLFR